MNERTFNDHAEKNPCTEYRYQNQMLNSSLKTAKNIFALVEIRQWPTNAKFLGFHKIIYILMFYKI